MPLERGASEATFRNNVREMVRAGHPVKQALAASYRAKRKATRSKRRSQRS